VGQADQSARLKNSIYIISKIDIYTLAHIDLNPVAAGVVDRPEEAEHTSIKQRVEHAEAQDATEALRAAELGSVAACGLIRERGFSLALSH